MRREDLQLRQLAKTGDTEACLKLGEAYLTGSPGIAKNTSIGISYLRLAIPKAEQRVASCLAKNLSLRELISETWLSLLGKLLKWMRSLDLKLSAWHFLRCEPDMGISWLRRCRPDLLRSNAIDSQIPSVSRYWNPYMHYVLLIRKMSLMSSKARLDPH